MKIVVFGDIHGKWVDCYTKASELGADLALLVGDSEPIRDERDLSSVPGPKKYRFMGDFQYYYAEGDVPVKTITIGGNHEPFLLLDSFPGLGGDILPSLFYLRSGVMDVGSLRIGGLSGTYVDRAFTGEKPNIFELSRKGVNFGKEECKNASYMNIKEVDRFDGIDSCDILLLHDWPGGISSEFPGSPPSRVLIERLKPRLVFCGHMHFPLEAAVNKTKIYCLSLFKDTDPKSWFVLDI
jgi:hypothetical protein